MERAGIISKVKIKMDEVTPQGVDLPFDDLVGPTLDDCAKEIALICPLHLLSPANIPIIRDTDFINVSWRTVDSNVATLETATAHGFSEGDSVIVSGMMDSSYDGTFTLLSVQTNSFTYALTHNNETRTAEERGRVALSATPTIYYDSDLAYILTPTKFLRLYEIKFPAWSVPVRELTKIDSDRGKMQDNPYLKAGTGRPVVIQKDTKPTDGSLGKWLVCGKVAEDIAPTVALYVQEQKPEELSDKLIDALTWLTASKVLQISGNGDLAQGMMTQYATSLTALAKT
jgi:hypothetical protein